MKAAGTSLGDCKTLRKFERQLKATGQPVVLVEGTRQVPADAFPRLVALGEWLARRYPAAVFRIGNASGADEAFADGVARADARRLEYVLPYATMRRRHAHRAARRVCLDAVSAAALQRLADVSNEASPQYARIVNYYLQKPGKNRAVMQAAYLLRDTLKVLGDPALNLAPATVGIFYVNEADPLAGGPGHTIRVCRAARVPVVRQPDWLKWLNHHRCPALSFCRKPGSESYFKAITQIGTVIVPRSHARSAFTRVSDGATDFCFTRASPASAWVMSTPTSILSEL